MNKYWRPITRQEWIWGLSDNDINNAVATTWNEESKMSRTLHGMIYESNKSIESHIYK